MKRLARSFVVVVGFAVAFAVVSLVASAPAHAQSKEEKLSAEKFFRAGERAYKAGQYLVAAQAFEEALKLFSVPAIVFSTAQAYRLQYFIDKDAGWLKRAIELYRSYVQKVTQGGRREDAVASLAELEPIISRLQASTQGPIRTREFAAATQLMVNSQVSEARVYIDSAVDAKTDGAGEQVPAVRKVAPGPHTVRVVAPGYFPAEQKVNAVEGRLLPVEIELRPMPARIRLRTESGARVAVDGRPAATTSAGQIELPAGRHFLTVTRRGRSAWSREVEVSRGQELALEARLRTTGQRRASRYVLIGSGVLIGISAITGIQALSANSDASDLQTQRQQRGLTTIELDEYERLRTRRDDKVRDTFVIAGIGLGVAATGVLMMLFDNPAAEGRPMTPPGSSRTPGPSGRVSLPAREASPPDSTKADDAAKRARALRGIDHAIAVRPVVGATGAGLSLSGRF